MRDAEFRDPRLVAVYDALNPAGADHAWFLAAAARRPGSRVVDLGCGTGALTVALAAAGHRVTGVDPAAASLAVARSRPGGGSVRWVPGTSRDVASGSADVALMTGHVAQAVVDDADWARALADLHRGLTPGGLLAFDSRDPAARGWQAWEGRTAEARVPDVGTVRVTTSLDAVDRAGDGAVVTFTHRFHVPGTDDLASTSTLRFRSEETLRADLAAAGFGVVSVEGGWHGEPVGAGVGELVVLARRA